MVPQGLCGQELRPLATDFATDLQFTPLCSRCLMSRGLCVACARADKAILPQPAINDGWLKMMAKGANDSYVPPARAPERLPLELPELNTPGRKSARRSARSRELHTRHGFAA